MSRARSGFDSTVIGAVKNGAQPPSALPDVLAASHQVAWTVFRFGPRFGEAFPDGQFPIEAVDVLPPTFALCRITLAFTAGPPTDSRAHFIDDHCDGLTRLRCR